MATEKNGIVTKDKTDTALAETAQFDIRSLIYVVRGQQVMFDSDLAMLYQVETKVLNQAVKRNISRFPDRFRFQLTKEEFDNLKSQFVTSSLYEEGSRYGGRRKLPYAFTEQGISMLSAVLRSEVAIQVSIRIMDTFVEMRKYLANNTLLLSEVSNIKTRQIEADIQRKAFEEKTERRFEQIFDYISEHEESAQKVFFDGQIYD
ncbi:MAG: ORF6N domain-containing protein, partial [Lachnospiraceae bacterium]|nr:ORF6N domain-containing protein [Lachnospiraceae bacterium]